ncbi:hypothetical protein LXL04_032403 [Taraxacum kok-saghyz]
MSPRQSPRASLGEPIRARSSPGRAGEELRVNKTASAGKPGRARSERGCAEPRQATKNPTLLRRSSSSCSLPLPPPALLPQITTTSSDRCCSSPVPMLRPPKKTFPCRFTLVCLPSSRPNPCSDALPRRRNTLTSPSPSIYSFVRFCSIDEPPTTAHAPSSSRLQPLACRHNASAKPGAAIFTSPRRNPHCSRRNTALLPPESRPSELTLAKPFPQRLLPRLETLTLPTQHLRSTYSEPPSELAPPSLLHLVPPFLLMRLQ